MHDKQGKDTTVTTINQQQVLRYFFLFSLIAGPCIIDTANAQIYLDSTASVEARVNDLLGTMTLDEKIGQMIQMHYPNLPSFSDIKTYYLGSLLAEANAGPAGRTPQGWADLYDTLQSYALQTRLKIPLSFALDAVHGFGAMYGATIFPHNIGLGCTRDSQLVGRAAQITAQEISATGIDWTLGPVVAVARNEKWGRTYESFGEDPDLVEEMSAAAVRGFQGDTTAKNVNILACAKHFIADGGTTNGVNNGNAVLDEQALRAIHLPGYLSSIKQKVGSIMVGQNQWNGFHPHGDPYLLDTLLKQELGFRGIVISDWNSFLYAGMPSVPFPTQILYGPAIKNSVNAGVDMAMMSNYNNFNHRTYVDTLKALINQGSVTIERIDDAVKRILTQKFRQGLFEHPYADRSLLSQVGSAEHRLVARECVRKSLVVLKKKDGVLPVSKNLKRIHLAGRHADNMGYQCGGWTITWQGSSGDIIPGTSIKEAVQFAAPDAEVTYSNDGDGAEGADIGIAVIGELPYAEGAGDGRVTLESIDIETVRNLKNAGIPVVVILISGRPMILDPILHYCDAMIAAWLPGTEGEGITDVLFGDYTPVGLLSHTWPRDVSQIPINVGDALYNPLFEYGYGITSLNDPPSGSSPEAYAASITTPKSFEISFSKKMTAPPNAPAGFSVAANGSTPVTILTLSVKSSDSTTFIATVDDTLRKENKYMISYIPGAIQSYDQGALAAFDSVSVYNLIADYQYIHSINEKIEAEKYYRKQGTSTITCSDVGGGQALSSIDDGDWVEYYVDVPDSNPYSLECRIASAADTGQIELIAKGESVSNVGLPVTGSWDTWERVSFIAQLTKGPQIIRVNAVQGGFRLNWIRLLPPMGVGEDDSRAVEEFRLLQNYPNPFNPSTTIEYEIPKSAFVTLKVFDILGREAMLLVNEVKLPGAYSVQWGVQNLPTGVYFYRLQAGNFSQTKKMILIK